MEVQKEQAEAAQEEAEDETPGSDKAKSKKKNQIKRKNANRQGGDLTSKIYQLMDRSGFLFYTGFTQACTTLGTPLLFTITIFMVTLP